VTGGPGSGSDFDGRLEDELRKRLGSVEGPSPDVRQSAYEAYWLRRHSSRGWGIRSILSRTPMLTLAVIALLAVSGSVAAMATARTASPSVLSRLITTAVQECRGPLIGNERSVGECVKAIAHDSGQGRASDDRRGTPGGAAGAAGDGGSAGPSAAPADASLKNSPASSEGEDQNGGQNGGQNRSRNEGQNHGLGEAANPGPGRTTSSGEQSKGQADGQGGKQGQHQTPAPPVQSNAQGKNGQGGNQDNAKPGTVGASKSHKSSVPTPPAPTSTRAV
jgi:hypothetical protein